MPPVLARAALVPHPATPCSAVRALNARVTRMPQGLLAVTYALEGELERLRLPAPKPPRMSDGLWGRTCCELFIARAGAPGYHELNFAPSGEWAVYAFERYRSRAPLADEAKELTPEIRTHRTAERFELNALVRLARLAPEYAAAPLSLAVTAVIEDEDGALSYWALAHPGGNPDFHHADGFALAIDEAGD